MNIPKHIAIIPDGNRRWARKKGLPVMEGHRLAAEKVLPNLMRKAKKMGVKYFTFWGLSTENLTKRTEGEIKNLFLLIKYFLNERLGEFKKENVRVKFIGDISKFPPDIQKGMHKMESETSIHGELTAVLALNYGGRDEIIRAVKKISDLKPQNVDLNAENFKAFLDTQEIPDPDLIIRTGGEMRLSGFLPWQSIYSELYFSDIYFPDFDESELEKAIHEFDNRQRRYGK